MTIRICLLQNSVSTCTLASLSITKDATMKTPFLARPIRFGAAVPALLACLGLSACTQMPISHVQETAPQDITANSQVLQVKQRHKINNLFSDGYFEIGDYAITGIRKGSISSSSSQLSLYSQSSSKTDFRFQLSRAGTSWDAFCKIKVEGNVIRLFGVDGVSQKNTMHCDLSGAQGQASLDLIAEMDSPRGQLLVNQNGYSVNSYSYGNPHPDRMRIPTIYGFRIDNEQGNQAAIELAQTPGRAWLNPKVPESHQAALVASLAALLIRHIP